MNDNDPINVCYWSLAAAALRTSQDSRERTLIAKAMHYLAEVAAHMGSIPAVAVAERQTSDPVAPCGNVLPDTLYQNLEA